MRNPNPRAALAPLLLAALGAVALAQERSPRRLPVVEIVNDAHPRADLALAFALPRGLPGEALQLRDEEGRVVPVQVTTDRQAAFVLARLEANERRRFTIEPALDLRRLPSVEALRHRDRVEVAVDGRPLLVYRAEKTTLPTPDIEPVLQRGGYIHPVITPRGRPVTDDYPPTRPHHHGVWTAWAKTRFEGRHPDFWNMAEGTGRVELESISDVWSGPVQGGLRARHRYVDLGTSPATTVLTEVWTLTAYAIGRGTPAYRVFDLVLRHDASTTSVVELGAFLYGPLGVRGNRAWTGARGAQLLTSEGKTRGDGDGTRARWCHIGGLVNGTPVGMAVMDHPQNVQHPQALRLDPTEPFFSYAPVRLGALSIRPGETRTFRYRFVVYDSAPDVALLERLWQDFAHPPTVTPAG